MVSSVGIVFKKTWISILLITTMIHTSWEINLGLLGGDLSKRFNPLSIRKYSHHSPVTINIHGLPTVPPKPPPLLKSILDRGLKPPIVPLVPRLPRLLSVPRLSLVPPLLPIIPPRLPFLPHLPLLPLLPPRLPLLLPPLLPPPILPVPRLPVLPPLLSPLPPLLAKAARPSLLELTPLRKKGILGSSRDILRAPIVPKLEQAASKRCTVKKLLDLRRNGSITMGEFFRFKKLLT